MKNKANPIPAVFEVNGILFGPKDDLENYVISVRPGTYEIRGGYIGKEWTRITIDIANRDSVIAKVYLKDDPVPLH